MGFFDDLPYQDPHGRRRGGPWDEPVDEFPSAVATGPLVLAQTEEVALAIIRVWAYESGFEFWLDARFHHTQPPVEGPWHRRSLFISACSSPTAGSAPTLAAVLSWPRTPR